MNSNTALDILDSLAATGSRIDKAEILARHIHDPMMQRVVKFAYDPFITFGVSPPDRKLATGHQAFDETSRIWSVFESLAHRLTTGGTAALLLETIMKELDPKSGDLFWRILSKDLRCGITEKTVNLVMPGLVPVFDVMLAKPYEAKRIKNFPVAVEPKLDGVRVICLVREGQARFFSRTGKPFPAVEHLEKPIVEMMQGAMRNVAQLTTVPEATMAEMLFRYFGGNSNSPTIALDGEITGPGHFNESSGAVRRKSEQATDAIYTIFDAVPLEEFTTDGVNPTMRLEMRREILRFILKWAPTQQVRLIDTFMAYNHDTIQDLFTQIRAAGGEGVVVKPLHAAYQKKRSFDWLKIKAEETEDLRVIGAFRGEDGTKLENSLGGLVVERFNAATGDWVYVSIGGGFKEDERDPLWKLWLEDCTAAGVDYERADKQFWKNQTHTAKGEEIIPLLRGFKGGKLLGRIIEVEYHEVTPDGSLRHPRIKRFRDDKTVSTSEEIAA